jgi:hypothetical protein
MLGPMSTSQVSYIPNFCNYVEALLSGRGILVEAAYAKSFFTADHI